MLSVLFFFQFVVPIIFVQFAPLFAGVQDNGVSTKIPETALYMYLKNFHVNFTLGLQYHP